MRTLDLDRLNLESARRAIEKAAVEKPWCVRDRKDRNVYRVRSRKMFDGKRRTGTYWVTFLFLEGKRLATCTCETNLFGAEKGLLCYHVPAAYFRHLTNLRRDAEREAQKLKAA